MMLNLIKRTCTKIWFRSGEVIYHRPKLSMHLLPGCSFYRATIDLRNRYGVQNTNGRMPMF